MKAEERVELARELHDTVAHHVSAIAIQAQAGRALAASQSRVVGRGAGGDRGGGVAHAGRDARDGAGAAQPGARRLRPAAGRRGPGAAGGRLTAPGPGSQVKLSGDLADLPAAVDAAVFRIAQEAVTNALRHARNATLVEVRVDGDPSSIRLQRPRRRRPRSGPDHRVRASASSAWSSGRPCSAAPVRPARAPTGAGWSRRPCPGR